MSRFHEFILACGVPVLIAFPVLADGYGLGRAALPEEIAAWDHDVRPDGTGLPPGQGSVADGEHIFEETCASCHGSFGEGVDNWPKLAGGAGTLAHEDPLKTVGSYWPYLSTTWDFVNRSMPFGNAQTLAPDDVYAITAYILYSNDLVDEDFVLTRENFTSVTMPNADGFFLDDRAVSESSQFSGAPCMRNCKDDVEITMRARVLDVTPEIDAGTEVGETDATSPAPIVEAPEVAAVAPPAGPDTDLVAAGEKVFRKCKSCHQIGAGAKNRAGPQLNGIVGRPVGDAEGFKYSPVFQAMADEGKIWNDADLTAFLTNPKAFARGTRMSFKGLSDADDLAAITAYLSSFLAE